MADNVSELEHAACRGCSASSVGSSGYCCAWCELGLRCPCEHGRTYTLLGDDQPRLFDPPPPVGPRLELEAPS
jgi:hypothetical protein